MGLFKRFGDIISANLGEMVDKFEDPEKMLKQAVREMEGSIAEATEAVAKTVANEKVLSRELKDHDQQLEQWRQKAEKAVQSDDEGLARRALERKGEHEKLARALRSELEAARDSSKTVRQQLDAMKAKHAEAKRKLSTLTARKKAADARRSLQRGVPDVKIRTDAFAKFDRMREKVELAEAEADALSELQAEAAAEQEGGVAEPSTDLGVETELAELKRKHGKA
jgi:phage shock protein A